MTRVKRKRMPPGMSTAIHILRTHKIFYPEDPDWCVGWSSRLIFPYDRPETRYDAPLWGIPHTLAGDPNARNVPVILLRGRLVEAWRIEWYRMTGQFPLRWYDMKTVCKNEICLQFDHMKLAHAENKKSLAEAVFGQMSPPDSEGHRMWNGPATGTDPSYPYIYFQGRTIGVRTLIYRAAIRSRTRPEEEDPEDYEVTRYAEEGGDIYDSLPKRHYVAMGCGESLCLEPLHMVLRGRGAGLEEARKSGGYRERPLHTHCKNGHEYTGDNFYMNSRGSRVCRMCQRDRLNRYRGMSVPYLREAEMAGAGLGIPDLEDQDTYTVGTEDEDTDGHDELGDWLLGLGDIGGENR